MQRPEPKRPASSYAHTWEQRRLKKAAVGPQDGFQHVNMLNGVRVERRGRGQPPASNKEEATPHPSRRVVQGMSHACR